jgi:hypothetical protein
MLDEYDSNIKPLLENDRIIALKEDLHHGHGIEVSTGPRYAYLQFRRSLKPWDVELRVFRFLERKTPVTPEEEQLVQLEERYKEQEEQRKNRDPKDNKIFIKADGKFLDTSLISLYRHRYKQEQEGTYLFKDPFILNENQTNLLDVQFIIRHQESGHEVSFRGSILDLLNH